MQWRLCVSVLYQKCSERDLEITTTLLDGELEEKDITLSLESDCYFPPSMATEGKLQLLVSALGIYGTNNDRLMN